MFCALADFCVRGVPGVPVLLVPAKVMSVGELLLGAVPVFQLPPVPQLTLPPLPVQVHGAAWAEGISASRRRAQKTRATPAGRNAKLVRLEQPRSIVGSANSGIRT